MRFLKLKSIDRTDAYINTEEIALILTEQYTHETLIFMKNGSPNECIRVIESPGEVIGKLANAEDISIY